jgi:hypothetical protein
MGGSARFFVCCLALVGASSLAACNGAGGASDSDRGVATIALTQVPTDVACIRVTVAGSRTVQKTFNVIPAQSSVLTLTGLPTGDDTFTGEAFNIACAGIVATTVPTWIGDPVTATVGAGAPVAVNLVLRRNGQATVSIDFDNGPDGGMGGGRPNGAACAAPSDCQSAFCVDGVCCDSACTGACRSCNVPGSAGRCALVAAGSRDPRGACVDQGAATCGTNGTCDGAGACARYAPGTTCAAQSCTGGVLTAAAACDGAGTCVRGPSASCAPFACADATRCATTCATNADCAPPSSCNGGVCGRLPLGAACTISSDCQSAFCVDGVCCNSACSGACQACNTPGRAGMCSPIPAGMQDPVFCPVTPASSCGTDGTCDGAGACRLSPPGTLCAPATCAGSVLTQARTCNGAGACQPGTAVSCAPFTCQAPQGCRTSCATSADCVPGTFCAPGALCQPQRGPGQACAANEWCISQSCVAGLCQ